MFWNDSHFPNDIGSCFRTLNKGKENIKNYIMILMRHMD